MCVRKWYFVVTSATLSTYWWPKLGNAVLLLLRMARVDNYAVSREPLLRLYRFFLCHWVSVGNTSGKKTYTFAKKSVQTSPWFSRKGIREISGTFDTKTTHKNVFFSKVYVFFPELFPTLTQWHSASFFLKSVCFFPRSVSHAHSVA
jgi:hypothetical protein